MDYGVFELESDDDERTRRLRDASIRATDLALTEPTISEEFLELIRKYSSPNRPCGCKQKGPHRKVCPESSDIPHWRVLAERRKLRIRAGVLLPGF